MYDIKSPFYACDCLYMCVCLCVCVCVCGLFAINSWLHIYGFTKPQS